jgi:phage pi2 protein 07
MTLWGSDFLLKLNQKKGLKIKNIITFAPQKKTKWSFFAKSV